MTIAIGSGRSIPVVALLLGIQLVAHDAVEVVLALLAGTVVM